MKTFQEWQNLYEEDRTRTFRKLSHGDGDYIRAIQLDAVIHGMRLAAEMLVEDGNPMAAKDRILDAANNLKEI